MTNKEAEIILVESLLHTKETRIYFFISKAKEMEISQLAFAKSLSDAYERLSKIVNTYDYSAWAIDDETGKKIFEKKQINLWMFTNGQITGTLNDDNVNELAFALQEFANQCMNKQKDNRIIENQGNVDIKNLTLYDFLDIITDTNNRNDLIFTSIEIFNYLSHITSNFEQERTKRTLWEIDCYYNMEYLERINSESFQEYIKKGWEIPVTNYEIKGKDGSIIEKCAMPDYKKMRNKTHIADDLNIVTAINLLKKKLTSTDTQKESIKTYIWQSQPEKELPELFNMMLGKFIASDTILDHFKSIFTGQAVDTIKPVKWHNSNASELLYFIIRLNDTGNIEKNKRLDYKKLTACFVQPNGTPFTASFKELKQNLSVNLSPDKQKAIDELVSNF